MWPLQASNLCTYIANGDVALSVLMTTVTTIGAIVMTPLISKVRGEEGNGKGEGMMVRLIEERGFYPPPQRSHICRVAFLISEVGRG